jgi:hypothetical protein
VYDQRAQLMYLTIRQRFTLWFVPFELWQANVKLVTVLKLVPCAVDENKKPIRDPSFDDHSLTSSHRYFIAGQEDLYQVNEFLKFIAPFGAAFIWSIWQLFATFLCTLGVFVFFPLNFLRDRTIDSVKKS